MYKSRGDIYGVASVLLELANTYQAQANWRTQLDIDNHSAANTWLMGEMTGYSTSTTGFPANMQPALAVAANSGVPNALAAWALFNQRAAKPNYADAPQWAIVPR